MQRVFAISWKLRKIKLRIEFLMSPSYTNTCVPWHFDGLWIFPFFTLEGHD